MPFSFVNTFNEVYVSTQSSSFFRLGKTGHTHSQLRKTNRDFYLLIKLLLRISVYIIVMKIVHIKLLRHATE